MPTTLWFDDGLSNDPTLPKLVATAHATLCFQLLRFLQRTYGPNPTGQEKQLWDRLVKDWQTFQTDPYAVLRDYVNVGPNGQWDPSTSCTHRKTVVH